MPNVKKRTTYFERAGEQNTDTVLKIVKNYAGKEEIRNIVVATTTGQTGAKAAKTLKGNNVVVVTHAYGSREPGNNELRDDLKNEILANEAKIFTGTHALSSAERSVRKDFGTIELLELIANVLRRFGEGTKVCVEITMMAADAGLIPVDKDIIAVAGTGRGADTALRISPAHTAQFFNLKIREVIAKPVNF